MRLARGRHDSPSDGACVVELAALLAGECFSDRPRSVSPVVRDFLHDYNDGIDYRRRQDLLELANELVGSRGDRHLERQRARRCLAFVDSVRGSAPRSVAERLQRFSFRLRRPAAAGAHAAHVALGLGGPRTHDRALGFARVLISAGQWDSTPVLTRASTPATTSSVEAAPTPTADELLAQAFPYLRADVPAARRERPRSCV